MARELTPAGQRNASHVTYAQTGASSLGSGGIRGPFSPYAHAQPLSPAGLDGIQVSPDDRRPLSSSHALAACGKTSFAAITLAWNGAIITDAIIFANLC